MEGPLTFRVEIRDLKATSLTTRNRFKDKIRIYGYLDDHSFKTKKQLIGGGDLEWPKFHYRTEYSINNASMLEEKKLDFNFALSKNVSYGRVSVDLYALATGPEEHFLPICNAERKIVGRFSFIVTFEQIGHVSVRFREVRFKNLPFINGNECNPYMKYGYSGQWAAIQDNKMKACYSPVREKTNEPSWNDLPEIKFKATMRELLHESIIVHVTSKGKFHNQTLARCNLLFRTLVENGKTFKDDDLISFKGALKVNNASIEGLLIFKNLPKYAQMKGLGVKRPLHTEKGILDGQPLLPGVKLPKISVILSDSENENRPRANTIVPSSPRSNAPEKPEASSVTSASEQSRLRSQSVAVSSPVKPHEPPMGTLISFSPFSAPRARSSSLTSSPTADGNETQTVPSFQPEQANMQNPFEIAPLQPSVNNPFANPPSVPPQQLSSSQNPFAV